MIHPFTLAAAFACLALLSACQAPPSRPEPQTAAAPSQSSQPIRSSPQTHPDDWTYIEANIPNARLEIQNETVTTLPVWMHKSVWDQYTKDRISTLITAINSDTRERDVKLVVGNDRRPRHLVFDKFVRNAGDFLEAYPIALPGIIGPVNTP